MPDTPTRTDPDLSLLDHLTELRSRLLRAVAAIVIVLLVLAPFARQLYSVLARPLVSHLPEGASMIAIDVASPFLTPFKLVLILAILIAMPYVLFQLWAFVAPGLYRHEQRLARPLLGMAVGLFYAGCAFAYFVVFPLVFAFFASMAPEGVEMMTDINRYLDFVLTLFLAFGIAFQVPVATIILVALGVTTPEALGRIRGYVIVGAFVVGMLLTPPDLISQTLLAVPVLLLYELGIVASRLLVRRDPPSDDGDQANS
jgi:sec-independent protein translocase protein TatC